MSALHALSTLPAASDMHPKPKVEELGLRDLRLVLVDDLRLPHVAAAAMRALPRQGRLQGLVDPGRNGTVSLATIAGAGLAPGPLRMAFRCSSGVRRGLSLRRSQSLFQRASQPLILLLQMLDLAFQACDFRGVGFVGQAQALPAPVPKTSDYIGTGDITLNKYQ